MRASVQILREAQELIRQGWTTGTAARDRDGKSVSPTNPEATRYCIEGGLCAAAMRMGVGEQDVERVDVYDVPPLRAAFLRLRQAVVAKHPGMRYHTIGDWNDQSGRTKQEVLQLLDDAIQIKEVKYV